MDRRGWEVLLWKEDIYTGVMSGVIGSFGRVAALAPRRWRGVRPGALVAIRVGRTEALGLAASGMRDGRTEALEGGVGRS